MIKNIEDLNLLPETVEKAKKELQNLDNNNVNIVFTNKTISNEFILFVYDADKTNDFSWLNHDGLIDIENLKSNKDILIGKEIKQLIGTAHFSEVKEVTNLIEIYNIETMKQSINRLMDQNYETFVKSLISMEKSINDKDILNNVYDTYMESDFNLLNDDFNYLIDHFKIKKYREEDKDLDGVPDWLDIDDYDSNVSTVSDLNDRENDRSISILEKLKNYRENVNINNQEIPSYNKQKDNLLITNSSTKQ